MRGGACGISPGFFDSLAILSKEPRVVFKARRAPDRHAGPDVDEERQEGTMLLYDRLIAHGLKHIDTTRDVGVMAALMQAQVFELSSVVPLFEDWEHGRDVKISKRPPYSTLWAEWTWEESPETRWRIGSLFHQVSREEIEGVRSHNDPDKEACGFFGMSRIRDDFWSCEEFYACQMFQVCHKNAVPINHIPLNQLSVQMGVLYFGMREQGNVVRTTKVLPDLPKLAQLYGSEAAAQEFLRTHITCFGLPLLLSFYAQRYPQITVAWPALMAFALLHCANVVTDIVAPAQQLTLKKRRVMQKHGHPLPTTYKILKLVIPHRAVSTNRPASGREGVRLHLCRGHFKNLQHERFVHKGYHWWPAHWRGDPDRGLVLKDYSIESRQVPA